MNEEQPELRWLKYKIENDRVRITYKALNGDDFWPLENNFRASNGVKIRLSKTDSLFKSHIDTLVLYDDNSVFEYYIKYSTRTKNRHKILIAIKDYNDSMDFLERSGKVKHPDSHPNSITQPIFEKPTQEKPTVMDRPNLYSRTELLNRLQKRKIEFEEFFKLHQEANRKVIEEMKEKFEKAIETRDFSDTEVELVEVENLIPQFDEEINTLSLLGEENIQYAMTRLVDTSEFKFHKTKKKLALVDA